MKTHFILLENREGSMRRLHALRVRLHRGGLGRGRRGGFIGVRASNEGDQAQHGNTGEDKVFHAVLFGKGRAKEKDENYTIEARRFEIIGDGVKPETGGKMADDESVPWQNAWIAGFLKDTTAGPVLRDVAGAAPLFSSRSRAI
jgi:hypothetical protein